MHELVLLLDQGLGPLSDRLSELLLQLIFFLNNTLEGLHTPAVELEAQQFLDTRVLVQEHIIQSLGRVLTILLVHVMLCIGKVLVCLESVALDTSIVPIENDPLIYGPAAHRVLHAADDLK